MTRVGFLVQEFGADRVMTGSDCPFDMGAPEPVGLLADAGLDAGARAAIEGDNAARFFGG